MRNAAIVPTLAIIMSVVTGVVYANVLKDESKEPQFLYVLSAKSGSFEGSTLTLNNVPLVIYFSDRPNRIAGHMSLMKFSKNWSKGDDSFEKDPPNAVLSIINENENFNTVLMLEDQRLKNGVLKYKVRLLNGKLPKVFGAASLFIDAQPDLVNGAVID